MTRTITKTTSKILEELELENETYVTTNDIASLAIKHGILTNPSMIIYRLKQSGWLLPTSQQGVWEFAPASMAGPYSKNDPLKDIIVFQKSNPEIKCFVCMQTSAWAQGLADRIPSHKELAFLEIPKKHIPDSIIAFKYAPNIEPIKEKGVLCLAPESIVVHIASKPSSVSSWDAVLEWFPEVVFETTIENLLFELDNRNNSVKRRTGYLLQGMYPEAAQSIYSSLPKPTSKIRFGGRKKAKRNDEKWMISDTVLPISPLEMEKVK